MLEDLRARRPPRLEVFPEPGVQPASIGLLAGSFDPITVAHAAMANAAAEQVELVVLVYSVRTLPKEPGALPPLLPEEDRVAALERFCQGRRGLAVGVCSHGLLADQADAAADRFPGSRIFLVIGSDKLLQLLDPSWYEDPQTTLDRLFVRAEVLFAMRAGDEEAVAETLRRPENLARRERIARLDVPSAVTAISSRRVRDLLRRGEDVEGLVPEEVRPLLGQFRPRGP